ncbi:prepilin-type N-terminal cleavage/methylation domain-containing protein [Desulfogranum mediterraneum]|uniref:prepilin-type N-terminal cleavage/methylation domain-containing protein n=1 Tax=Desulfogranum mediterraneum TaxID=160661 RepID=UPI000422097E|nr:prepilin-type N-terminal cleavage/methylation domain-containing protein [Desulfogranum mediterraneum]
MNRKQLLFSQQGFTLIEALVAMLVLTTGIFSLYSMQISAIQGNSKAQVITTASNWAAIQVEDILTRPYEEITDANGDGNSANEDSSGNDGIDDVLGNGADFGLDNVTAATADGSFNSPDSRYTIFWNVADGVPVAGSKTVRIHVQDNNNIMRSMVTYNYIKQEGV